MVFLCIICDLNQFGTHIVLNLRRRWSTFFYVLRDRTNWREGRIWRHAFCDPMFLIIFVLIPKDSPAL